MTRQQFHTTDVLRLEVETPTEGEQNLIQNPSGDLGAWGWVTVGNDYEPDPDLVLSTGVYGVPAQPVFGLKQGTARPSIRPETISEPVPVTPGDYVKARVDIVRMPTADPHAAGIQIRFLDANREHIGSSLMETEEIPATLWTPDIGGQVPAGAAFAAVAVNYRRSPDGTPATDAELLFRRVMLAVSDAPLPQFEFQQPNDWHNVLGPTHDITINREDLNVGTMTATILDATMDPSQSDLIRPGKKCRAQFKDGETWQPLFTGEISEANVSYDRSGTDRKARISLTAVDAIQRLAASSRPEGVAKVNDLPYVLEGCGVPWSTNGRTAHIPSATVATYNESASALDQIAITRDSQYGFAWVDRRGVMQVWSSSQYSHPPEITLTESDCAAWDIAFSTDDCINEVRVVYLRTVGQETEEVSYGPYRDQASINEWGLHSAEFKIVMDAEDPAAIADFADNVLYANGTPQVRVNSVTTVAYRTPADLRFAHVDIADEARVERSGHSDSVGRVTALTHTITPSKWTTTYTIAGRSSVAMPQQTPPIQSSIRPDVGIIEMYAGATPPPGRLLCDGASYPIAAYPDLFTVIGHTYGGTGDYFNVPNLSDRFPIGVGPKALGTAGGSPTTAIPDHTHGAANLTTNTAGAHVHTSASMNKQENTAVGGNAIRIVSGSTDSGGAHSHNVTGTTGGIIGANPPVDTMPPWRALNFTIRA